MTDTKGNKAGFIERTLSGIERVGNKLPDPAMLFLLSMFIVWALSWFLSDVAFTLIDPRTQVLT